MSVMNIVLTNSNDSTVPLPKYLRAHPFGPLDALAESHPPHTRVYHRASGGALCTVAYAVSQRGARKLLHEFRVKKWSRIWDVEMGDWCAGWEFSRIMLMKGLVSLSSRLSLRIIIHLVGRVTLVALEVDMP
jgi:hypothetical protein